MAEQKRYSQYEEAWNQSEKRVNTELQLARGFQVADVYLNRTYLESFSAAPIVPETRALMDTTKLRLLEITKIVYDQKEKFTDKLKSVYGFKKNVAYDIDSYSNGFFYYDQAHDASFIADKESYQKCLKLCTKAAEIYSDEYTQKRLENAQYYGKKEWDSWNIESIKALTLYGLLLTAIFFPVGLALLAIDAAVIYFSFRPYWQINKTYVTGEMGGVEKAVTMIGDFAARFGGWFTRFLWNLFVWFIKFIISLCGGAI